MSLTKLLKISGYFFKKNVITFLIIRRHDLRESEESLRYISVRPNASISDLRKKIWFLLELPDFCDERIVLSYKGVELPLVALLKGNNPQDPYIMEVWSPAKTQRKSFGDCVPLVASTANNMITMGESAGDVADKIPKFTTQISDNEKENQAFSLKSGQTSNFLDKSSRQQYGLLNDLDFKPSDLSFKKSNSTFAFKMYGRKNNDNFTNILLKIQSDLSSLGNKLTYLENKLPELS